MEHHFNTSIAKAYGIEESILLHHFYYWIAKNAANGKHFYDGLYWTYNSKRAYADFFNYMNETKIFRVIKHLEEEGIVVKGQYNEDKWDKTNWYAITEKGLELLKECGYEMNIFSALLQNDTFDSGKMNDGTLQNERCIIINNTDNNTDSRKEKNKDKSLSKESTNAMFEECWIAYKRKGSKKKAYECWNKLADTEKQNVLSHIKPYVASRELKFQKDFERYLRDRIFLDVVISKNNIIYDPTKLGRGETTSQVYMPSGNFSIMWDEQENAYMYIGFYSDGHSIGDGYTDANRPNGAKLVLNNGRGTIVWNSETKKWERK